MSYTSDDFLKFLGGELGMPKPQQRKPMLPKEAAYITADDIAAKQKELDALSFGVTGATNLGEVSAHNFAYNPTAKTYQDLDNPLNPPISEADWGEAYEFFRGNDPTIHSKNEEISRYLRGRR